MDAQGTMRLKFDTMDAYDGADFDHLAEISAEDASGTTPTPNGPHFGNRDDIFATFRQRRNAGIRIAFGEMRSTPMHVLLTARIGGSDPVVTVFSLQARPPPHLLIRKAGRGGPVEHLPRAPTV